jgi:hypothetical protein
MSAQDNLSKELFFEAHRGLQTNKPSGNLGAHWTTSPETARLFTIPLSGTPNAHMRGKTIISANIPMSSVETNTKRLKNLDVLDEENNPKYTSEDEVTVKSGAPVFVKSVKKRKPNFGRTRTRSYNPPREMKA